MAKASIVRPTLLHTSLPEDIRTKLDLLLWSDAEGRVPKGAYQRFILDRLNEFFTWQRIPLEAYGFPQGFFVVGPPEMLETILKRLKG